MSTSKDILFCHLFHYKEHIFVAGNTKKNKQTRQKHASGQSNDGSAQWAFIGVFLMSFADTGGRLNSLQFRITKFT